MRIKSIITLIAVGGIAGGAYYFRDGIQDAFATGKDKVTNAKDKLQDGYAIDSNGNQTVDPIDDNESDKDNNGKGGNGKGDNGNNAQIVYIPIYQNDGQQSYQNGEDNPNNSTKQNPESSQYIKEDKKKTQKSISKFSSPYAKNNPDKYAEKKYGINYETLSKAASKVESKRTTDEKKAIEAAKAREVFDSRSISNW